MRRAVAAVAALSLFSALAVTGPQPAKAAPAPLPSSRLEFGLSNLDASWMTASGVPWGYRFQYLAGGVNTANPWPTWQDPALPPGQFAVDFMNNSTTAPANYIPVFTYYELLQSLPSTGSSEAQRDFNNLNNASTMASYYANFKLLMQKAGAYGKQVVVHVEPDFWGYMQMRGQAATAITAKVKGSGFAEAASYTDNLAGFAAELKHLRDTYAPNAVLAMHASMWASSIDIASNTSASINARTEADKTAAFLNSVGMWDAVFQDVDDHNAAWWELASCGSPPCVNSGWTHWWDPNNVKFPNFTRYLDWSDELHTKTGRPQVVWQVPMGNQYFLTMNNTCGHYQDNVAPYFISHAQDLFNAGLVAVLFGPANDCQTMNEDREGDGITNNAGNPTTDTLGGCTACNTNASTVADDDGGYLRIFVGRYYGNCAAAAFDAPGPTQAAGSTVSLNANSAGCDTPQYEFWVRYLDGKWYLKQGWGGPGFAWDTSGLQPGTYTVHAWANQDASGHTTSTYEALASTNVTLTGCTAATTTPPAPTQLAGSTVNLTTIATGCPNPIYEYWVQLLDKKWYLKRSFSPDGSWSWDTTGLRPGTYTVHAWANQQNAYTGLLEATGSSTVKLTGCTSASLAPASGSVRAGTRVTFTASSNGCPSPAYEFWMKDTTGRWHRMTGFGGNTWTWINLGWGKGKYVIHVWANQQGAFTGLGEAISESTYSLM
jgi:hypothetical protein